MRKWNRPLQTHAIRRHRFRGLYTRKICNRGRRGNKNARRWYKVDTVASRSNRRGEETVRLQSWSLLSFYRGVVFGSPRLSLSSRLRPPGLACVRCQHPAVWFVAGKARSNQRGSKATAWGRCRLFSVEACLGLVGTHRGHRCPCR